MHLIYSNLTHHNFVHYREEIFGDSRVKEILLLVHLALANMSEDNFTVNFKVIIEICTCVRILT